jgi:uncharacterized protein YciI
MHHLIRHLRLGGWLLACSTGVFATAVATAAETPALPSLQEYYVALLHKGPHFDAVRADPGRREQVHQGHLAFINRHVATGRLMAFGPLIESGELRGMYIFTADSLEQAQAWADSEPSTQAGMTVMRVYRWLGHLPAPPAAAPTP